MGTEQGLEAPPFIGVGEAVEHDGVLTHVGVHVQEDLATRRAQPGQGRRRQRRPVPDATHLDDDLARSGTVEQRAP